MAVRVGQSYKKLYKAVDTKYPALAAQNAAKMGGPFCGQMEFCEVRCVSKRYTPTGKGLGLDSSVFVPPVFQRSKRPWSRLIRPVYQ